MKRKYIDRSNWQRIRKSKSVVINTFNEQFEGYASAIFIETVYDKLVRNVGTYTLYLVDDGYTWVQRLPIKKNWALTTMFDEKGSIIQWYFDITKQNAIDESGNPFYDDLYLDVVVLPSGEISLLDEDELETALAMGSITQEEYVLAYREANEIMSGIAKDIPYLLKMSHEDLNFLKQQVE